ncbi:family 16 glycosylhydrolase [Puia sp. P3]|uniref:glycoside hydrolase family 16 protein n=1 Tax=Puia sp. P3 TaxID=3423952 RepID=UPI003D665E08
MEHRQRESRCQQRKEYYQAANATVTGGNLVITARQQSMGGQPYTSAKLETYGKFSTTYGRIEARIKLPMVQGTGRPSGCWVTALTRGTRWPDCGEIDIMEHVNTTNTILGTMHWNGGSGHVQYGSSTNTTPGDYHVYAVEWDAQGIRWYVDNTLYVNGNIANNINNTGAFHNPFYIILNLAIGGDLPGNTIDNGSLPTTMMVDYVRVYSMTNSGGSGAPIGQTITLKGSNGLYVSGEDGTKAMTCTRTTAQALGAVPRGRCRQREGGAAEHGTVCLLRERGQSDHLQPSGLFRLGGVHLGQQCGRDHLAAGQQRKICIFRERDPGDDLQPGDGAGLGNFPGKSIGL